jgi:L-lysine 2,3-aminomutase
MAERINIFKDEAHRCAEWNDWKWQFRNRITTVEELRRSYI